MRSFHWAWIGRFFEPRGANFHESTKRTKQVSRLKVGEVMTEAVITVSQSASVGEANKLIAAA